MEKIDQILFGTGSLNELKPFFPNQEAVLNFYARRMAESFPPHKEATECACCQRHSSELQAAFVWRGAYHTKETTIVSVIGLAAIAIVHHLFSFLMPEKHIIFSTTHSLCNNCFRQVLRRKMFAALLKQLCLVLVVLSTLIFAAVIVYTILFLLPQPTTNAIVYTISGICTGFLLLTAGLRGEDRIVRWILPESMKFIAKPPFQLVGLQKR
jgi:hypothetical protein